MLEVRGRRQPGLGKSQILALVPSQSHHGNIGKASPPSEPVSQKGSDKVEFSPKFHPSSGTEFTVTQCSGASLDTLTHTQECR